MTESNEPGRGGRGAAPGEGPARIAELMMAARQHHLAGRLAAAEPLYRQVLTLDPDHAEALNRLGVLASQLGRHDAAAELIGRAITVDDSAAGFHSNLGTALRALGRLDEAVEAYGRALALNPSLADTHSNLGNALRTLGREDEAAAAYQRAIALRPDFAVAHNNLAAALQAQGRIEEAAASSLRAIALKPDLADAHNNLGNALKILGRLQEAEHAYQRAVELQPDFALAYSNLGVALQGLDRPDDALAAHQRAVALDPGLAVAHNNLGNALRSLGRSEEAEPAYRRALALNPDLAEAHCNLGGALAARDQFEGAVQSSRRAIALKPDLARAHDNLGTALWGLGRLDEAEASLRQAVALDPELADAHNHLGIVLQAMGRTEEAMACYHRAIEIEPGHAGAYANLGSALETLGRLGEAEDVCRGAVALAPDVAETHNNLGVVLQAMGRFEAAAASYQRAVELKPGFTGADSNRLFCLLYDPSLSAEALLQEHRGWDARHGRRAAPAAYANVRDPGRRLRVGYVSGDFRNHPVGYFLAPALAAHDRSAVESFCYSTNVRADDMTARLRAWADHWRSLVGLSDEAAAAMIRADGVDILVDLSGHTDKNRLPLFTRRPAPVQASWLGYPGTTGLSSIDYLVMDAATTPPGTERWCVEALARLPFGRFCYAPPAYAPAAAEPPSQRGGPLTFGSFNNLAKIGPGVVRLWAAVMEAVPDSRLLLKWKALGDPAARARVAEAFAAAGVADGRLELRGHASHRDMLAEYGDVDIALDPFPFCGGLTSCEAMWMGAPVVTLPGERPASRQTLAFLEVLGLDDLAAQTEADYVRIAAALAADPGRRAALRRTLRPSMAASTLCAGARFTPTLEAAYRRMWRAWCAHEPAATFDIAAGDRG